MKQFLLLIFFIYQIGNATQAQTYSTLWIPDTISGTTFNLVIKDTFAQLRTGNQTITGGINKSKFWGPTLFMNKGDLVKMNVTNKLNDSTTLHWHGMHLPAVMDGGPHQVIPPGTVWQPYWTVKNQAATSMVSSALAPNVASANHKRDWRIYYYQRCARSCFEIAAYLWR